MKRDEIVDYINEYLSVPDTPDYSNAMNGLQVEGRGEVTRIMTAVDATEASISEAAARDVGMLLVHHGLFWEGLRPVTGRAKRRLAPLIKNDISLYSVHLPLDAHPEVGNNAVLARMLGLPVSGRFAEFHDVVIGVYSNSSVPLDELALRVKRELGVTPMVLNFGPPETRRIGVVSGGGGSSIIQALASGIDTVITGEISHNHYFDAEEHGLNIVSAGHYATETVGIRTLGKHLSEKFGLEHSFFDHPTGL